MSFVLHSLVGDIYSVSGDVIAIPVDGYLRFPEDVDVSKTGRDFLRRYGQIRDFHQDHNQLPLKALNVEEIPWRTTKSVENEEVPRTNEAMLVSLPKFANFYAPTEYALYAVRQAYKDLFDNVKERNYKSVAIKIPSSSVVGAKHCLIVREILQAVLSRAPKCGISHVTLFDSSPSLIDKVISIVGKKHLEVDSPSIIHNLMESLNVAPSYLLLTCWKKIERTTYSRCAECGQTFSREYNLTRHIDHIHGKASTKNTPVSIRKIKKEFLPPSSSTSSNNSDANSPTSPSSSPEDSDEKSIAVLKLEIHEIMEKLYAEKMETLEEITRFRTVLDNLVKQLPPIEQ